MSKIRTTSVFTLFACFMVSIFAQAPQASHTAPVPPSQQQRPSLMEVPTSTMNTSVPNQAVLTERRAMTVDELINSGKLAQGGQHTRNGGDLPFSQVSLNGDVEGKKQPEKSVSKNSNAMSLTGIYMSSESSKVAIEFNGRQKTYTAGDFITGGWKVLNIDASGVDLERCVKTKCYSKFLVLND